MEISDSFESPVSLALILRDNGLDLAGAHAAVTELAERRRMVLTVAPRDPSTLVADLTRLNLVVRVHDASA